MATRKAVARWLPSISDRVVAARDFLLPICFLLSFSNDWLRDLDLNPSSRIIIFVKSFERQRVVREIDTVDGFKMVV